jgi:excisionase family DNA binding protein
VLHFTQFDTPPAIMASKKSKLLKRSEAAEELSVSIRTLDLLVSTGELKAVRIGRVVRIRPADLESFVESNARRAKVRA